jgi:hypothetical protein
MKWVGHVARKGEMKMITIFWLKILKRPLGRPRHRWEDNVRMELSEMGWEGVDWIHLAQDRDYCEHGNEPSGCVKGGNFLTRQVNINYYVS